MQNNDQKIQDLTDQLLKMRKDFDNLSQAYFKNNFSAVQDFNKASSFTTSLKLPIYTTLPNCEVGQVCAYSTGGTYKLMIATATNVWTIVGTQS